MQFLQRTNRTDIKTSSETIIGLIVFNWRLYYYNGKNKIRSKYTCRTENQFNNDLHVKLFQTYTN